MVYSKTLTAKSLLLNLPDNSGYLLAYSGGADSTALLHALAHVKNIRAIHINHGIQEQAKYWQKHCQQACEKLNIPLIVEYALIKDKSEQSCRKARYDFFKKHLLAHEILLTAHHQQDQVETVLLKLFRGTGVKGICGIESLRKFAKGYIARPLLNHPQQQLKAYLIEHKIKWIEDDSNQNNDYKRNALRNLIIPQLQKQFPNFINNVSRSADNFSQSLALLNHFCDFQGQSLPLHRLFDLPTNLQTSLIYHWISQKNLPAPNQTTLTQISHDFIYAKIDKNPHYKNDYYQLYRSHGEIYCIKNFDKIDSDISFKWHTDKPFVLPNQCGTLTYSGDEKLELIVKFNQKGQKLKSRNHNISKHVKKLFQEQKVHQWDKQNTPFIYFDNKLISLGFEWSPVLKFTNKFELSLNNLFM